MEDTQVRPASSRHKLVQSAALLVVLAVTMGSGWALRSHFDDDARTQTVVGTISLISYDGGAGCIRPASGGKDICSSFFLDRSKKIPALGDKVRAERVLITDHSTSAWILVVGTELE